jgi:uncharacterized cupredoxin-like copper-binding protein
LREEVVGALALTLFGAACGSDAGQADNSRTHDHGSGSMGEHGGMIPGELGQAEDADREIQVTASDDLKFTPASIKVSAGETVTFVVHDEGDTEHEFVLGDEATSWNTCAGSTDCHRAGSVSSRLLSP